MIAPSFSHRRAMTLVELLVVLAILGLLGVAVSPLIQSRDDKQTFRAAADALSLHFADAASRAIGEISENGVWFEPLPNSVGAVDLAFARSVVSGTGTVQIDTSSVNTSAPPPTVGLSAPITPNPIPGAVIRFLGSSSIFQIVNANTIRMMPNRNLENDAFPVGNVPQFYQVSEPPKRKNSYRARRLAGNACVDLRYSSIGVDLDGAAAGIQAVGAGEDLSQYSKTAILFDPLGRPSTAWLCKLSNGEWKRIPLGSGDVVVLLVGSITQVGVEPVPAPTEDNPGANIQNPYSVWLLLDPKTGSTSVIENKPSDTVFDAQTYVRQKLGGA